MNDSENRDGFPNVVYRTVQIFPGLQGRCTGPIFRNEQAAKETLEEFARKELGVRPDTWTTLDDGSLELSCLRSSEKLRVERTKLRDSPAELVPAKESASA